MMASVSNGFFSTGSILILCCCADAFDVLEHRRAAVAHQLHGAEETLLAERDHGFDGVGRIERDIVKDRSGLRADIGLADRRAVGEFLVSMPEPCSISDRKCRMLGSSSTTKQSGAPSVASGGAATLGRRLGGRRRRWCSRLGHRGARAQIVGRRGLD